MTPQETTPPRNVSSAAGDPQRPATAPAIPETFPRSGSRPIPRRPKKRLSDWLDNLGEPDWQKYEDRFYRRSRLSVLQARRSYRFRDEIRAEKIARNKAPEPPMRPARVAPAVVHGAPLPPVPSAPPVYPSGTQTKSSAQRPTYPVGAPTALDTVRRWAVTLAAVVCILGSAAGVGAFGGPAIAEAANGAFGPSATLLAPASTAFGIWSLIYLGLIGYTVHQWLPAQGASKRHRKLGWLVAASMVLNLGWILCAQAGLLDVTVILMALLLAVLITALRMLNAYPSFSRLQAWLVDIPLGLYLGWIIVAAAANAAAWLTRTNIDLFGWGGTIWAVVALVVLTIGGTAVSMTDKGRIAVALAIVWGLFWLLVQRLWGEPTSTGVAFTAGLAAFLVLVSVGSQRHRVAHAERQAVRRQWSSQQAASVLDLDAGAQDLLR